MYYCKFTTIVTTGISAVVNGMAPELPKVGSRFFMYVDHEMRAGSSQRYIWTAEVVEVDPVDERGEMVFRTAGVTYVMSDISRATPGQTILDVAT